MIKKYEIINDGGKKRIKALRSFHVQGRYVNIGDVGGIVYDENTLSQEGNAWIFSGNLNYPSIRVSGDSIVDTNGYEAEVTNPRPFVNVTGASALIGAHEFVTGETAPKTLAVSDVEQGSVTTNIGSTYAESKVSDDKVVRLKNTLYCYTAGVISVECNAGYKVSVLCYDKREKLIYASGFSTGVNVTDKNPAYISVLVKKTDDADIIPGDITAANARTSKLSIESYLDINDSRLEFRYSTAMTVATKVNAANTTYVDVYKSVIDRSNLTISKTGNGAFTANILANVVKCNVEFSVTSNNSLLIGNFANIDRLINDGSYSFAVSYITKNKINARDCYTFTQSEQVIPKDVLSAVSVDLPFKFIRCNVEHGLFYHNANVKNIYTDIDFAKASVDLGKTIPGTAYKLVSSEVEGMYRICDTVSKAYGYLVEAYDSVAGLTSMGSTFYNTTIYKDAYIRGKFEFAGTNVFGNKVPGHPRAQVLNARGRVVQGTLNALANGSTVTGIVSSGIRVVTPIRYRINSVKGISVKNLPTGIRAQIVVVNERNVIEGATGAVSTDTDFTKYAAFAYAYIIFSKTGGAAAITPDELGDTTITVYNGCKIINTGSTAINMKGNIRVEDNATLVNASVTGSGYFGGDSVTYYNPTVWASLDFVGTVFMKDKAVFAPTALTGACALVRMEGNAKFIGSVATPSTNLSFIMRDNSVIEGISNTRSGVVMSGNAKVTSTGIIAATSRGVLVMEDNATVSASLTAIGAITLAGNYSSGLAKTWTGKRTITSENAPEYDNNVKTQYDF